MFSQHLSIHCFGAAGVVYLGSGQNGHRLANGCNLQFPYLTTNIQQVEPSGRRVGCSPTTMFAVFLLILTVTPVMSAQKLNQPYTGNSTIDVTPMNPPAGYSAKLTPYRGCQVDALSLGSAFPSAGFTGAGVQHVPLANPLAKGDQVCILETYTYNGPPPAPVPAPPATLSAPATTVDGVAAAAPGSNDVCGYAYNDCDWVYTVVGGVEQSDLSSQNSQTTPFIDLIRRGPTHLRLGSVWLQARFLGSPTTSSTQNVVAAATNPTGTVTSSSLATVGTAIDYVLGVEHDWLQPNSMNPTGGQWTLGVIAGFGATTPLSSQSATVGYAVPAYGTNECTQLSTRFQPNKGYSPALPGPASITTTTTIGSNAPTTITSPIYCSVQTVPTTTTSTANGVVTTVASSGTQITNIAFSPEDRSSFLLKYGAGVRFIQRTPNASGSSRCPCTRSLIDFTVGQDQAITGGYLRHMVFKSDAILPIPNTGIYFFASAAIRIQRNQTLAPLILASTPVTASSGTSTAGTVVVPSPSVFVLPLKQSDRDFYRVGIGIDLATLLPNLFKPK
jgi:hypothetical protein